MPDSRGTESQREMLSLVTARVRDAYVRKPVYVDGSLDLVSVCRLLSQQGVTHTLVRDGARLGIFTTTDLRDALLRDEPPATLAVREVSRFELIEVRCRRRAVRGAVADGAPPGAPAAGARRRHGAGRDRPARPGQLRREPFAHRRGCRSTKRPRSADLKAAAERIDAMVTLLHDGGMRIERISRLVGALNQRLIERLWSLLAPPELVANSCLLVMGSEGRGEQILKTDQDNALLLRDGYELPQLPEIAARFNDGAGAVRLSALPRRHHADQPAVARQRGALSRDAARLDLRPRSAGRDAPGDLFRRRAGGRRCHPAAGPAPAPRPHPRPAGTRSSRASPPRPTSSTNRRACGRA